MKPLKFFPFILVGTLLLLILFLILFLKRTGLPPAVKKVDNVFVSEEAERLADNCQNASNWLRCYTEAFSTLTKKYGFDSAVHILGKIKDIDERAKGCHLIAHKIVLTAVASSREQWEDIFKQLDPYDCGYGFLHGILESRRQFDSSFALNTETVVQFCDDIAKRKSGAKIHGACIHMIGHVLLVEKEGIIADAAHACSELPEPSQISCYTGVFMENFTRENLVEHGIAEHVTWDERLAKDQEVLCNSYSGTASLGCWIEIFHLYQALYPYDVEKLFQACGRATNIEYRDACYTHGVAAVLIFKVPTNDNYVVSLCNPYRDTATFERCVYSVVNGYIKGSKKYTDQALHYCSLLPDTFKKSCYGNLGKILSEVVGPYEQQAFCDKAPLQYRTICNGQT